MKLTFAPCFSSTAAFALVLCAASANCNRSFGTTAALAWTTGTRTSRFTFNSRPRRVRIHEKQKRHQSQSVLSTTSRLQSTVAPVPSSDDQEVSTSTPNSSPGGDVALSTVTIKPPLPLAFDPDAVVVAEGTVVSYFRGGLAAIQVSDDDRHTKPNNDQGDADASSSGTSNEQADASSQSDDLIGRQVVFANGVVGMVMAQRPPILFCYTGRQHKEEHEENNSSNTSSSSTPQEVEGKVQVLDSMAQVQVTDSMRMVDCFGRPFESQTTTSSSSSSSAAKSSDHNLDNMKDVHHQSATKRDIFGAIPQVADIALINTPMLTGETMIDALAPIGRGQNMLLIGSDLQDMRGLATDFVATQTVDAASSSSPPSSLSPSSIPNTKCVYATTRDPKSALERLKQANLLDSDNVIVVSARSDKTADPAAQAAEAVAVAATACAIGESFAQQDLHDDQVNEHQKANHALVIVDTIDDFKVLWDVTTRVLVQVFGVDAVVKDDRNGGASSEMRAFYSSLIQRAGQFKESKGGGSITLMLLASIPSDGDDDSSAVVHQVSEFDDCSDKIKARLNILVEKNIPLTAANLRKIDIPIPTISEGQRRLVLQHMDDLISMSDGQIWFDEKLAREGQCPPMDPQRSITRVGIGADTESRADAPAVRRMVEGLRLDLAQAASMDGAEVTAASSKQVRKRNAWLLAMHQKPGQGGRTLAESCVALLAASTGALDDTIDQGGAAGTDLGQSTMRDLIAHVESVAPDAVTEINETLDIHPARRTELVDAIHSFFS